MLTPKQKSLESFETNKINDWSHKLKCVTSHYYENVRCQGESQQT